MYTNGYQDADVTWRMADGAIGGYRYSAAVAFSIQLEKSRAARPV